MNLDVPSPMDLRSMTDASAWAATAIQKSPYRTEFFDAFSKVIRSGNKQGVRILELGSGPGFLAKHLLDNCSNICEYVALDFSAALVNALTNRQSTVVRPSFVIALHWRS